MAELRELLSKVEITDETLKGELESAVSRVLKERGEFGSKLIEKDREINGLKEGAMKYGRAKELLEKNGVSADEIPTLLEKLGLQKTLEDEHAILKEANKSKDKELSELRKALNREKNGKKINDLLLKELSEFRNEEGKNVKLIDAFVNKDKLIDSLADVADDTVVTEKIRQALKESYVKQEEMKAAFGITGAIVPRTPGDLKTPKSSTGSPSEVIEVLKEHGPLAALAAHLEGSKQN